MKKILVIAGIIAFYFSSSGQSNGTSPGFILNGNASGFPDGTQLFLSDLSAGTFRIKDFVLLQQGKFRFAGTLTMPAAKFAIHTKDFNDRVSFWLENTTIDFSAEKGKFMNAAIKGSKTQVKKNELDAIISSATDKKLAYIRFIKNNPGSIVSADLLNVFSSTWNKDTVSWLYNQFTEEVKSTIYGTNIFEFLSLNVSPDIGDKSVDFSQANTEGTTIHLSDFQGKVVLLEFWGSWCMPCRQAHPELVKTYNEFKNAGFEILGVAADNSRDFWLRAIKEDGLTWQNVSDLRGDRNKAALVYGVSYYPTNFLIDKNGIIVAKDVKGEKLREKLKTLLQ